MFRTLLVLLFLAACGFYFQHNGQQENTSAPTETPRKVDDSSLEALKRILPSILFEKDVRPAIDRNRAQGLTDSEINALIRKLDTISRALGGKTSEAVERTVKSLEKAMPPRKDMADRTAEVAGTLAKNVGEGVKASLPVITEFANDILRGAIAVFSNFLGSVANLLQK